MPVDELDASSAPLEEVVGIFFGHFSTAKHACLANLPVSCYAYLHRLDNWLILLLVPASSRRLSGHAYFSGELEKL